MIFWSKNNKLIQEFKTSWGKTKDVALKFELIEHYHRKRDTSSALQVISDRTINDLDFYSLFSFTDRSNSSIGRQYLFDKLLTIGKFPEFEEQETLITHLSKNEENRLQSQLILSKLNDEKAFYISWLFLEDFVNPPKYLIVIKLLSIISFLTFISSFLIPKLLVLLIGLFATNLIFHYANKKHIEMYSDSIPRLSLLCKCVRNLLKIGLPIKSVDLVVSSLKSIDELKNRIPIFSIEANQNLDFISGLLHLLIEYIKIQFLLEPIIVFSVLKKLREKRTDIKNLFEYFGKIDSAISIASLRHGLKIYSKPKIDAKYDGLSFTDLYHPLIQNCIPNSMNVNDKSILLTGSNMSGKTTFIRSVAINALFAQTINTCFASDFQTSPLKILSAIRISDDVLSGKSYYFEEVLTINEMIRESQSGLKTLFLLDEIFKGTNTVERIAAGKTVLSYICKNGNIVFVSTHDIELTSLLQKDYELSHFTEIVENGQVHFDYKLKNGELKTRNAIRILEINGYPKELIEEAKELSNQIIGNTSK